MKRKPPHTLPTPPRLPRPDGRALAGRRLFGDPHELLVPLRADPRDCKIQQLEEQVRHLQGCVDEMEDAMKRQVCVLHHFYARLKNIEDYLVAVRARWPELEAAQTLTDFSPGSSKSVEY